jgi:hypothetical protein
MWRRLRSFLERLRAQRDVRRFNTKQTGKDKSVKIFTATLPQGCPASKLTLRLSVPPLPAKQMFAFSDHVIDETGQMTNTVLATTKGGFAISRDLGRSWEHVPVKGYPDHQFIHVKSIGRGEFLAQVLPHGISETKNVFLDLLVLNERGDVLATHPSHSHRWHSCRAIDLCGDTLIYAEYASNRSVKRRPRPSSCRVLRSRDRGRSWQTVFTQNGKEIRHFHFLQARPGVAGEWWLTSGDLPHESHIWVSRDDGDTWTDLTGTLPKQVDVGGSPFNHALFRLTDLYWLDNDIVWGTDDHLSTAEPPGARVFRSPMTDPLETQLVALGRWHFRSIVDIGDFLLLISQRSRQPETPPEESRPGVYLMPKKPVAGAPALVHLFDLEAYFETLREKAGFTFSKASRAAVGGTFFSYRSARDVFPLGHKILEWNVTLE